MVRKHLVDKKTTEVLLSPYKDMITEYKEYMVKNINDTRGSYDKVINIGKSLVIIKEYVFSDKFKDEYFSTLLISDINSCLYCIRNNLPKRFFYFSFRGCIESFARLNIIEKSSKIVDNVFKDFKKQNKHIIADNEFYQDFFSVIKSKYTISSGYVHGSMNANLSLKESIEDFHNSNSHRDTQEMIEDLEKIVELIKKFYLKKDTNLSILKHAYHRRIIILKYLLTNSEVRQLF
ncbi:hypothetical protein SAMN00017405_0408 [Desulfonispora thiosulfatigenes DSM 11270]|uniref:Uncharacterized protein n=1 Tax=Desulfonispora thiosulfatigenes DSM 11270 TaxID=656914 RepID=A0A1W1VQU6_DESTI|nr:hypothetical protein [Desulfonispora thiosulfatigenes]SMB95461.1 hypothetical protein SAMN00017405_0408 [Desulfonispora thiosulfatigenes DSM 11270]